MADTGRTTRGARVSCHRGCVGTRACARGDPRNRQEHPRANSCRSTVVPRRRISCFEERLRAKIVQRYLVSVLGGEYFHASSQSDRARRLTRKEHARVHFRGSRVQFQRYLRMVFVLRLFSRHPEARNRYWAKEMKRAKPVQ